MTGGEAADPTAWDAHTATSRTRHIRLGVDVGDVRVGFARSDPDGLLATPVETLARAEAPAQIAACAAEESVRVIMVGLPRRLDGGLGPAAQKVQVFCEELTRELTQHGLHTEIRLVDERFTTTSAHQALHRSGRKGRRHREVVDQVAAVMILQQALDQERSTGTSPGEIFVAAGESGGATR
ncbi:Holliday junction resolvase RuvX [Devriesea agamarum]|uniref:Holliday junction resolvase RuvX n=1 Tax=Devriesea agamarum TaxID=472569 RepID=UPI000A038EF3|nr:Holliday junction resolvase RuvX [Devriesea agamarum]